MIHVLLGKPFEDQLQNTLWPEIHKLYGHSYELFCIASSPDGKLVASACIVRFCASIILASITVGLGFSPSVYTFHREEFLNIAWFLTT